MKQNLRSISLMTALTLLIILISSCATVDLPGWTANKDGTYTVTKAAGREAAQDKAENKLLKKEVADKPTVWQSITHNTTVFGIGAGVGFVTGIFVLP